MTRSGTNTYEGQRVLLRLPRRSLRECRTGITVRACDEDI